MQLCGHYRIEEIPGTFAIGCLVVLKPSTICSSLQDIKSGQWEHQQAISHYKIQMYYQSTSKALVEILQNLIAVHVESGRFDA